MPTLGPVDALWFGAHPEETHRIRPATAEEAEAEAFAHRSPRFPQLMTVVRGYDGTSATYAFTANDPVDRACDWELASWFDADLDAEAGKA